MTARSRITLLAVLLTILTACHFAKPEPAPWPVNLENQVSVILIDPPAFTGADLECLQLNVYHEAGNQSRRGKEAVALVTLNRARTKHFPSTICGVVKQGSMATGRVSRNRCQFSWYCDGKSDFPNLKHPHEARAWKESGIVARNALEGKIPDFLGRSTHYHATYVRPNWSSVPTRYRLLTRVGDHKFYRDIKLGLKA